MPLGRRHWGEDVPALEACQSTARPIGTFQTARMRRCIACPLPIGQESGLGQKAAVGRLKKGVHSLLPILPPCKAGMATRMPDGIGWGLHASVQRDGNWRFRLMRAGIPHARGRPSLVAGRDAWGPFWKSVARNSEGRGTGAAVARKLAKRGPGAQASNSHGRETARDVWAHPDHGSEKRFWAG
jgi:hypothetical protein